MKKKKVKKGYGKYLFGYIALFIVLSVGVTMWKVGAGETSTNSSKALAAVGVTATSTNPTTCLDTDGPKNFYAKGQAYGTSQAGRGPETKWWTDYCINANYVYDFTCKTNVDPKADKLAVWASSFKCPRGCLSGACNAVPPVATSTMSVSGLSAVKGQVVTNPSGVWIVAYPVFTFTLTNNGNDTLYVNKDYKKSLGLSGATASSTVSFVSVSPDLMAGDTMNDYEIPPSSSRTFSYNFVMGNPNGTTTSQKLSIVKINYGPAGSDTARSITSGLGALYVQVP